MKPTEQLHALGQSLWLDHISRGLLDSGTLARYIDQMSVTGLTSNPTIFDQAIETTSDYDAGIRRTRERGLSGEPLFFDLAIEDLRRAADLFAPVHQATGGTDGWVSLEVSPLLVDDAARTLEEARRLHAQAGRPNLFIKIPGTPQGAVAIADAIRAGVPVNVTLLFSREHYLSAADAYMTGLERRLAAGLDPGVASVASLFVSRWDKAVMNHVPDGLRDRLGIAVALQTYQAYRETLGSERWKRLSAAGARPQRLLWASTGTKDPAASDVLYLEALAAADTINTMPEATLLAFAAHGHVRTSLPSDGGDSAEVLARFAAAGVDAASLAARLQREGADAFTASWRKLLQCLESKSRALAASARS